jgi:hypothetical protein
VLLLISCPHISTLEKPSEPSISVVHVPSPGETGNYEWRGADRWEQAVDSHSHQEEVRDSTGFIFLDLGCRDAGSFCAASSLCGMRISSIIAIQCDEYICMYIVIATYA